jgi:hypothetical protein
MTPTWPADHDALVILADTGLDPLTEEPLRFRAGAPVSFVFDGGDDFIVFVATFDPSSIDLDRCIVGFGGAHPLVPATSWRSSIVRGGEAMIALEADSEPNRFALATNREGCSFECPTVATRDVELATTAHPAAAVLLDPSSALIVMRGENRYFHIDRFDVAEIAPPIPGAAITSAAAANDGELWLGAADGRRFRGTMFPAPAFEELPLGASATPIGRIVVSETGAPLEVFSLAEGGEVERFDGSAWTLIGRVASSARAGGLAWVGPGEAIAVSQEDPRVLRHRNGATTYEMPGDEGYASAARLPGVGTLIGGVHGRVSIDREDGFESLGTAIPGAVLELAPIEGGFLAAGAEGHASIHLDGIGFCPAELATSAIRFLLPVQEEILAVRNNEFDASAISTYATWVSIEGLGR